jgi:SAM-dependent methyltransferase
LCNDFFYCFIPLNSKVLDMACGYGHFINNVHAFKKFSLDINPDCSQYLKDDIHFLNMSVIDMKKEKMDLFDVVFTSNFLEHLSSKDELELVLDNVWDALSPNGKFLIMGPNIKYLGGAYWDFYDHHIPLTHNSLCEVLQLKGFKVEFCLKKFLPYTTKGKLPTHPLLVKIYLKIPLLWKVFGKQFFVIAKKEIDYT